MLHRELISWGRTAHDKLLAFSKEPFAGRWAAQQFVRWAPDDERNEGWVTYGRRQLSAPSQLRSIMAQACGIVGLDDLEHFVYSTLQVYFAEYGDEGIAALADIVSENNYDEAVLIEAVLNLGQVRGNAMQTAAYTTLCGLAESEGPVIAEAAMEAIEAIVSHRRIAL
jgi:hypothetical protein